MKKRMGFVSNSSSTSFCIVGYALEESELIEKMTPVLKEEILIYAKKHFSYEGDDVIKAKDLIIEKDGSLSEVFYYYSDEVGIDYWHYYDCSYVGKSIFDMKDEETLKEFKERVKKELSVFNEEPEIIVEAFSDY